MIFRSVKVPVWALAGLIDDDYTGLTEKEVDDIVNFKATYNGLLRQCPGKTKKNFCLADKDVFASEHNGLSVRRWELCVLVLVVFE